MSDEEKKPKLNDVLGALVSGVAHARRVADAEVMRIAKFYRNHEYLNGLSVPRLRISRIAIDLPVLFDQVIPAERAVPHDHDYIASLSREILKNSVRDLEKLLRQGHNHLGEDVQEIALELISNYVTDDWLDKFEQLQSSRLQLLLRLLDKANYSEPVPDITLMEEVGESSAELLRQMISDLLMIIVKEKKEKEEQKTWVENAMTSEAIKDFVKDVRGQIEHISLQSITQPASFNVRVDTEAIKNAGSPQSVTRLRMALTEEGLEWSTEEGDDGGTTWKLLPE